MRNVRRWGDNDRHAGPFTYAYSKSYRPFSVILGSGHDEYPGCNLRLSAFGHTLIIELPSILKPSRTWVDTSRYEWSTSPNKGYWAEHAREYGFSIFEGHLNVSLGRQTHDSSTEQRWGCFLPWTQWRFIRHSLYGLDGGHFWTDPEKDCRDTLGKVRAGIDAKEQCPSTSFEFDDFDGERIFARTIIEEREWRFGTGWFKWLSLFRRAKVRRDLDIRFSKETGRRKGSWKGGTLGHSIDMLPGELHEAAFRRYCAQNNMTFVGRVEVSPDPVI
jgi:hypothetical protein